MLGKPKFKEGQKVKFTIGKDTLEGSVYIIDEYGTFEYDEDVSYDIMVESKNCLYKHIPEKLVEKVGDAPVEMVYPLSNKLKKKEKKGIVPMTKDTFVQFVLAAAKAVIERQKMDKEFVDLLEKYNRAIISEDCAYDLFGEYEPTLLNTLTNIMEDGNGYILDYVCGSLDEDMDDEVIKHDAGALYDDLVAENFQQ